MTERMINSAWRFVLISVIFVLGAAAMFQIYQGMLDLLSGHWRGGIAPVVAGWMMGIAVYWLAKHRADLVDV
jgi:hypothetical protein